MPRHDWQHDELMGSDRTDRGYREFGDRDRGAFFDRDRDRDERQRGRTSGWGSLLADESSGGRDLERRERSPHRRFENRGEREFGPDDERRSVARDETERLIASNKVEGTPVYDRNGDRLGSIHNFMVDKFRGRVVYAVLKHSSGFLGLDERYYPLDWDQLTYDTRLGGYHIDMTEDRLVESGSWDREHRWQERGGRSMRGRFDRGIEFERGRGFGRSRELELHRDRERREFDSRPDYARGPMSERW